jgi:hypothetical protein
VIWRKAVDFRHRSHSAFHSIFTYLRAFQTFPPHYFPIRTATDGQYHELRCIRCQRLQSTPQASKLSCLSPPSTSRAIEAQDRIAHKGLSFTQQSLASYLRKLRTSPADAPRYSSVQRQLEITARPLDPCQQWRPTQHLSCSAASSPSSHTRSPQQPLRTPLLLPTKRMTVLLYTSKMTGGLLSTLVTLEIAWGIVSSMSTASMPRTSRIT